MRPEATWGGWDAKVPPVRYLVDQVIVESSVSLLVAKPGSLKSWVAFSIAVAVASGRPWLGKFPVRQGKVLILDYESGRSEALRRMAILGAHRSGVGDNLGYMWGKTSLGDVDLWKWIASQDIRLIIVDSLAHGSFGVDENSPAFAAPLVLAGSMSEEGNGTATLFIHHARKSNSDQVEDARDSVRGSGAVLSACETAYRLYNSSDSTCRMVCIKQGAGRAVHPVSMQLTDAYGLKAIEE